MPGDGESVAQHENPMSFDSNACSMNRAGEKTGSNPDSRQRVSGLRPRARTVVGRRSKIVKASGTPSERSSPGWGLCWRLVTVWKR